MGRIGKLGRPAAPPSCSDQRARMFCCRMTTRSARDQLDAKMLVHPTKDLASASAG